MSSENEMVGRKSTSIQPKTIVGEGLTKGEKDKWAGRVNKSSSNNRAKKSGSSKQKLVDQAIQTWATRLELELTNGKSFSPFSVRKKSTLFQILLIVDEPSPSYWRELAESRGSALEEAMIENEYLHNRIDELETENSELEELVQEAKNLAEMVQVKTPTISDGII